MRVLFLSQIVPYPPHGGVLQRGYNLLRHAASHVRIHLLAFVHPDVLPTAERIAESQTTLSTFCEAVELFPLWAKRSPRAKLLAAGLSALSRTPFSVIAHRSPAFAARVAEIIASGHVDVVHVDTIALHPFVPTSRPLRKVLTHHNIESTLMARRAKFESHGLGRWFMGREARKLHDYEQTVSGQYERNIMMSALDADALRDRVPGVRTAVVPNGVDIEYFTPGPDPEAPTLIYTGGMNMFANRDAVLHFLRDIWPQIKGRVPAARFVAVGQDPPPELRDIAAADSHVTVTGYVDDIRPFVRQAAVYVVPLRVGGGTRLKVLDAMAMGKPLVSTSVGCEGIAVTPDANVLVADDERRFAEATAALLGDRERRIALGLAARALVEQRYAWPIVGRQLVETYQQAVGEGAQ